MCIVNDLCVILLVDIILDDSGKQDNTNTGERIGSLSVCDPLVGFEHQEHCTDAKSSFHFFWTDSFTAL